MFQKKIVKNFLKYIAKDKIVLYRKVLHFVFAHAISQSRRSQLQNQKMNDVQKIFDSAENIFSYEI